jgi:serine/threonine-protein kinase
LNAEPRSGAQAGNAKQWLGQLVDGLYPLREYLGTDETGAVYATEFEGQPASIKVVPAAGRNAEQRIARWRLASKVSHPHLIRLWKVGKAQLNGASVAYVVMECAEENLGQVLPERALTPDEAKEMLGPALAAIACIHREGFVHGRLTPANITAVHDVLKLASDSVRRVADVDDLPPPQGAYRPPEVAAGGKLAPAADMWALGVTLVEVLTQRRPTWTGAENELVIPDAVGEPFLDIIRRCLRPNPQQRCSAADVVELLRENPVAPVKPRRWW